MTSNSNRTPAPECVRRSLCYNPALNSFSFDPSSPGESVDPPFPKSRWVLTQEAFDLLLAQLDTDRQQAGAKYEALRRKLVKFFEWRGCSFPEDLTDDTINRVARNLEVGEEVRDLAAYCAGVARLVFLESLRARQHEQEVLRAVPRSSTAPADESDQGAECLDRCLRELSPQSSDLIVQYYQEDKQARIEARQDLAERLGIPMNALRIRAHRIRARLEDCVKDCMRRLSSERNESAASSP